MDLRVLGSLEVVRSGASVPLGGPKQRAVLALLAQAARHRVRIDEVVFGVYGDRPPSGARRSVQTYVSNLRHELGDHLRGTGDGYLLDLPPSAIDAGRFETAYEAVVRGAEQEPERAAVRLREALALWRGHPYADVECHGALDAEIARLEELRLAALERRVEADLDLGRHRELIGELEALTAAHPYRESLRAHQAVALYRAGRQRDALTVVERTRRALAEELGIDPSPQLQVLERRILTQDPTLTPDAGPRIERRTVLVAELEAESWNAARRAVALTRRDETLTAAAERRQASLIGLRGTAAYVSFADITAALQTAVELHGLWPQPTLRLALDHGDVEIRDADVSGPPLNRVARIVALAHPGQVLLSPDAHRELVDGGARGWAVTGLGQHVVAGIDGPVALYQLHVDGALTRFPPLRSDGMPPAVPRSTPTAVPGYELRTRIGVGGFSTVYRAYQASVGREVAVRAIGRELASDPAFIRRFEAEGQRVARLAHPHVLPVLDYWRDPEGAYLVQPLVTGGDLRQRLARDGPLERAVAFELLEQVGSALAHAHERGVVHGRLHPGNVLLDEDDNLYVADLGLAQMCEGITGSTATASTAPEALGGGPVAEVVDVYAFGVLATELLTGVPPPPDGRLPVLEGELGEVLARATSPDPDDRFPSIVDLLAAMRGVNAAPARAPLPRSAARNPYKGIEPFLEADAVDFRGREALVGELVEQLTRRQLLSVVGPSGIGKSSVVRAGLIPALRAGAIDGSQRWLVTDLFPGAHPFEELTAALHRVAVASSPDLGAELREDGLAASVRRLLPPDTTLLLVVDQFEELFTQTPAEDTRRRFLALLADAATDPTSPVRIVVTLRADLLDRPLRYAAFAEPFRRGMVVVRAPNREELARAVREPAEEVGVAVEERLVDRIVADADGQPGALPLLQHVLSERFTTRVADVLGLADYDASGGLRDAVGREAERRYLALPPRGRDATRDVFLRLVTVDEEHEDTRRRIRVTELHRLGVEPAEVTHVLEEFGRHRLLTFDHDPITREPTVEVAHEALLRDWDRLRGWIDGVRDDLLTRRRISTSAAEWDSSDRDPSFLLRGGRLETAERWHHASGLPLTGEEQDYLAASRAAADAEADRTRRRRRRSVSVLVGALVVTLGFSAYAVAQRGAAEDQARLSQARALAGEAQLAVNGDPELGILLALEAVHAYQDDDGRPVPESLSALHAAVQASRVELHLPEGYLVAAVSPDGRTVATDSLAERTTLRLLDLETGALLAALPGRAEIGGAAFSPDGETLAVSYGMEDDGTAVELFEAGTWRSLATYDGPADRYAQLAFTDDGRFLGSIGEERGVAAIWEVAGGARTDLVEPVRGLAPVPGGGFAVTPRGVPEVWFIEANSGEATETLPTPGVVGVGVAVDGEGRRVAVGGRLERSVQVWDRDSGARLGTYTNPSINDVAWAPDGRLAHSSNDGTIRLVRIGSDRDQLVLPGHSDGVTSVAFSPDGRRLVSVSWADETRVWDLTAAGPSELGNVTLEEGRAWDIVAAPDGEQLGVTVDLPDDAQRIERVEPSSDGRATLVDGLWRESHHHAHLSRDLGTAAGLDQDQRLHVYELPTGRARLDLPPCLSPRGLSADGARLVVDGRLLCTLTEQSDRVLDPPADAVLRSAIVDAYTGAVLRDLGERPITFGVFGAPGTPTERFAVVVVGFETVELHDLEADRLVGSFDARPEAVLTLGGSDGGRYVALNSQSGLVTVLDLAAVEPGGSLEDAVVLRARDPAGGPLVHSTIVGERLVTATMAGHVRLYDLARRRLLADLEVGVPGPTPVHLTAEGSTLFYADGPTIRRFEVEPDQLVSLARSRLTRGFRPQECDQYGLVAGTCPAAPDGR
jgi:DNA-binding SARP family transcriptional activator/serine/threonine protein kinase